MKDDDLLKAIGGINEKYINEADLITIRPINHRRRIMQTVIAAASIAIVAGASFFLPKLLKKPSDTQIRTFTEDDQNNTPRIMSLSIDVPLVVLSEYTSEELVAKHTAVLVYDGNVYTHSCTYTGNKAESLEALLDQRLGTATGSLSAQDSQQDDPSEFLSNLTGDVYSLKGYGTEFRLCVKREDVNEIGEKSRSYEILELLNGINLSYGYDLFEYRLHLTELTDSVLWETREDWERKADAFRQTEIDNKTWTDFLEQTDSSVFFAAADGSEDLDKKPQAHLLLMMKDGTEVRLTLIEGGYVGYENLKGYFVKIPEEIFNKVYDVCGGKH